MMERLTFEGNFCDICLCAEVPCVAPETGCSQKQVWERLKQYEDTGLTPEQVQRMRWIPVEERLPVDHARVLCIHKSGYVCIHEYLAKGNKFVWDWRVEYGWKHDGEVTHWMPFPEPPEVKNDVS